MSNEAMMGDVKLSERQQYWVDHLRAADAQQVSLAGYAREQGVAIKQLYAAKAWLVKLGKWPRKAIRSSSTPPPSTSRSASTSSSSAGSSHRATDLSHPAFVAVRMVPSSTSCVISHSSGWRVECGGLPAVEWLSALVRHAVVRHAGSATHATT